MPRLNFFRPSGAHWRHPPTHGLRAVGLDLSPYRASHQNEQYWASAVPNRTNRMGFGPGQQQRLKPSGCGALGGTAKAVP
jgi:hypothetical protein